ncbi:OsmC family protein [Candidatus Woesearchaeota archaeon]|nr:OsmC family protein [Candidatus Woesearchaeota archaeon]
MNNVNAQEMEKFAATVMKDSSVGKKNKKVKGEWYFDEGKPQFASTVEYAKGSVVLKTELPPFAGGWGTSPDPIQYCLHGIAACFAVTFAATATAEKIELKKLEVTAENWMDLSKQLGFSKRDIIEKVRITVHAEGPDTETIKRLVKLTEERCPGSECVTRSIPLEVKVE